VILYVADTLLGGAASYKRGDEGIWGGVVGEMLCQVIRLGIAMPQIAVRSEEAVRYVVTRYGRPIV